MLWDWSAACARQRGERPYRTLLQGAALFYFFLLFAACRLPMFRLGAGSLRATDSGEPRV
jgi:hypothetical protein